MSTPTKYAQIFNELVSYVAQFDSDFPGRIKGASRTSLETLQQLAAPNILPEVYVAFLDRMGADSGGLNITVEGTTNIDGVIQTYRNFAEEKLALGPGCFLIGRVTSNPVGLYQPTAEAEPEVVFMESDGAVDGPYGESLPKLLFRKAFDKYRWRSFRKSAFFSCPHVVGDRHIRVPELEKLATKLGFSRLWFSGAFQYCGELGQEAAMSVSQFPQMGILLKISASSRREISRLAKPFKRAAGLRFREWMDVAKARKWEEEQRRNPRF